MQKLQLKLKINAQSLPMAVSRAVHFPGTVYLQTFGLNTPYSTSESIVGSFWFASAGTGIQTFVSSFKTGQLIPVVSISKINVGTARKPDMRIFISLQADGTTMADYQSWVSAKKLPVDNAPHHLAFAINTLTKQALHNIDGLPALWDMGQSHFSLNNFRIPYVDAGGLSNEWIIGATLDSLNGHPTQYLIGDLAELFYFNGPLGYSYVSLAQPTRIQGGFGRWDNGIYGPVELGPEGRGVMPRGEVEPIICCRAPNFSYNHGGSTSFISSGGVVTPSADAQDPWQIWP